MMIILNEQIFNAELIIIAGELYGEIDNLNFLEKYFGQFAYAVRR